MANKEEKGEYDIKAKEKEYDDTENETLYVEKERKKRKQNKKDNERSVIQTKIKRIKEGIQV